MYVLLYQSNTIVKMRSHKTTKWKRYTNT